MSKYIIALVGIGVLITSLTINYFLFNKYDAERNKVKTLELQTATLQLTLDYEHKQQEDNDKKIADFKIAIDEITAQRESYRRKMQEALKKDENLKTWADTELPGYVRESFNRVRIDEGTPSSGNR